MPGRNIPTMKTGTMPASEKAGAFRSRRAVFGWGLAMGGVESGGAGGALQMQWRRQEGEDSDNFGVIHVNVTLSDPEPAHLQRVMPVILPDTEEDHSSAAMPPVDSDAATHRDPKNYSIPLPGGHFPVY